jgi:hypothetical protein
MLLGGHPGPPGVVGSSLYVFRMGRDRRTQAFVARRTAEGESKREIIRCLKRDVARELYRVLISGASSPLLMESWTKVVLPPRPAWLDYRSITPR